MKFLEYGGGKVLMKEGRNNGRSYWVFVHKKPKFISDFNEISPAKANKLNSKLCKLKHKINRFFLLLT